MMKGKGKVQVIAEQNFVQYIAGISATYAEEKDLIIVLAERKLNEQEKRSELNGILPALELAEMNPEKNILLASFLGLEEILKMKEEFALFLSLDNSFFLQLPILELSLERVKLPDKFKEFTIKAIANMLVKLDHNLARYLVFPEEKIEIQILNKKSELERAKRYFPELRGLSGRDLIRQLSKLRMSLPIFQLMKDREISGVYCDIEGTLLVDGVLQEQVLDQLEAFEAQGLSITIWTLGSLEELEPLIQGAGIRYPVKNKAHFSGAIAEIVIDDEPEEVFRAKTLITPKLYIRV